MLNEIKSPYPIEIKRSAANKRVSLRVKKDLSGFLLTLPARIPLAWGQKFVDEHSGWLIKASRNLRPLVKLQDGTTFPFFGEEVTVIMQSAKRGKAEKIDDKIIIYGGEELFSRRLKTYLKDELLTYIKRKVAEYAQVYSLAQPVFKGGKLGKIAVHDTTSRWGSCSSKGNLSFCFNLCFAEKKITDYVIAHELSHLKEMNHSDAFWKVVESLYPEYKTTRKWLKQNGSKLHGFVL